MEQNSIIFCFLCDVTYIGSRGRRSGDGTPADLLYVPVLYLSLKLCSSSCVSLELPPSTTRRFKECMP